MTHISLIRLMLVVTLVVALLGLGAISVVDREITVSASQQPELGTKERPIYFILVPSVEAEVIKATGEAIAADLYKMTGLYIVARMAADYAGVIEAIRAAEGDTFAIPTTAQFCELYEQTNRGVHTRLASVRRGYTYYFASFYAPRDKGFTKIEDLQGKTWISTDPGSTSGYKIPKMVLEEHGVKPGRIIETPSHVAAMTALLEGQGDFASGYGSPPDAPAWMKEQGVRWEWGDDPELMLWDRWNNQLFREGLRWKGVDLRYALEKEYPDIWERIGVVDVAGPIPNDSITFVNDFPRDKEDIIVSALIVHIRSPEGKALWSQPKFYEWTDMAEIDNSYYRLICKTLGYKVIPGED